MTNTNSEIASYALGYTENEQCRLMHQATLLAPCNERLFRAADIGPGDRVLGIGSGIGDVSILVGHLVGPTGTVVGVEQDLNSTARAEQGARRRVSTTFLSCNRTLEQGKFQAVSMLLWGGSSLCICQIPCRLCAS